MVVTEFVCRVGTLALIYGEIIAGPGKAMK